MIAYSKWCQIHDLQKRELTSGPEMRLDHAELLCSRIWCCVLPLVSLIWLCDPRDCSAPGLSVHGDTPGRNTGVGSLSLLEGIFLTHESSQGLPHCCKILYQLSYEVSRVFKKYKGDIESFWHRYQKCPTC